MIGTSRYRLLAIELNDEELAALSDLLRDPTHGEYDIVRCDAPGVSGALAEPSPFDAAIVGPGTQGLGSLRALAELRRRSPFLPVVVITGGGSEGSSTAAVPAGAATVLWTGDSLDELFKRTVTGAIERGRAMGDAGDTARRMVADREMRHLRGACGPAPLMATHQSLGSKSLKAVSANVFQGLAGQYGELLDQAMTTRTRDVNMGTSEDLQALASRLGTMNVGPRDIIDLHRTALAAKLRDQSAPKAEAFVEEGRMLMIQLMGYVLSYYRTLAWGAPQTRDLFRTPSQEPDAIDRTKRDRQS